MSRSCCSLSARHVVGELQNNAGENILRTRSGNLVVLVDSQTYGSGSTGGNFALIKLAKEQGVRQFDDGATVQ